MADLLNAFSSLLKKFKPKPRPEPRADAPILKKIEVAAPLISEAQLRSFDADQLSQFIAQQPERVVLRILNSLTDQALQLRVVQGVNEELTLKRVSRSQLNKKVKRAAEKKLRETGTLGMELRLQKLAPLNERMQAFLGTPHWEKALELLSLVSDPGLINGLIDENNPIFTEFQALRHRLKLQAEAYELTCTEMENICLQLEPSRPISKSMAGKLQDDWKVLSKKYSFPKNFGALKKYEEILAARMMPQTSIAQISAAPTIVATPQSLIIKGSLIQQKLVNEQKAQEESQARLVTLEKLLCRIQEVKENLTHRQAGPVLRELQNEAVALRRWRREYPAKLNEVEILLKTLSSQRTEAVDEAKWDAWARTDLAIRIQTKLEQIISGLETEQDPLIALKNSIGLTGQLHEYAKEMRALGSLESGKGNKIWQQFKSISDRGWAVCDRMRLLVLERAKAVLSEHASKPIEFTVEALSNSREPVSFNASAFAGEVPAQIKELRFMWLEIGTKTSVANRELETVFTKLFEMYFRQINLYQGQLQRTENTAVQIKQDLLKEMKIACEGKSTLVSRARVAKGLEEKWKKAPMPASVATAFQSEFEGYQTLLKSELTAEAEKSLDLIAEVKNRSQEVLEKILAKTGTALSQVQRAISDFEVELLLIEKHQGQFNGLQQVPENRFQEVCAQTQALIQECKTAATKEIQERAQERDRVLQEAQTLALSTDWEASRARFDELTATWKKSGILGQSQDATFGLLFENVCGVFHSRFESRERVYDAEQKAKSLKMRKELIYSLEALTRFRDSKTGGNASLPLPFGEEEMRTNASGKLLEFGLRYKHILSLDPTGGTIKETKKTMEQWSKMGMTDEESLPAFWNYYLDRVHTLLEI